ncbi:MAG TPA: class IV adenylate cyclase [Tepidisphaeraceae bacterium]|jgi:adenylate cyclase class 2
MAVEIEVKVKVEGHEAVREKLRALGAEFVSKVLEVNTFLDTADHELLRGDRGLRLRTNVDQATGSAQHVVTYKGPRQAGTVKKREEVEVVVENREQMVRVMEAIGYAVTLSFEKRRETWKLGACEIVLDELPMLGMFLEIEGPGEQVILELKEKLGLGDAPAISDPYVALLEAELKRVGRADRIAFF